MNGITKEVVLASKNYCTDALLFLVWKHCAADFVDRMFFQKGFIEIEPRMLLLLKSNILRDVTILSRRKFL